MTHLAVDVGLPGRRVPVTMRADTRSGGVEPIYSRRMRRHDGWGRPAVPVAVVVLLSVVACTGSGHPSAPGRRPPAAARATPSSAGTGSSRSVSPDVGGVRLVRAPAMGPVTTASLGDPLFPGLGNGGYDVQRYDLRLTYPKADPRQTVRGSVTVTARATAALPVFDLDFSGGGPKSVAVDGRTAAFRRRGAELVVTPALPVAMGAPFTVEVDGFTAKPVARLGGARRLQRVRRHAGRHRARRAAGRDAHRLPVQRPPERQGRLHVRARRPRRVDGRGQRRAGGEDDERRADRMAVPRGPADGDGARPGRRRGPQGDPQTR